MLYPRKNSKRRHLSCRREVGSEVTRYWLREMNIAVVSSPIMTSSAVCRCAPVALVCCPSLLPRALTPRRVGLQGHHHLRRRALAGLHRAIHVAVPDRGRLRPCPMQPPDRRTQRLAICRPDAGRHVCGVPASRPLLPRLAVLNVLRSLPGTTAKV